MFDIFGITFHWYGFLIGLGVWVAMEIALAHRGDLDQKVLEKIMWWTVFGGVIGARLYHVVDYWSRYYSKDIPSVLYFWDGGLGIWGAIGGGFLALFIFSYFNKLKFFKILDCVVIGVPLAQAIGRIGNYINGELYGKNGEPLFAYEGVLNLILFGLLLKISSKQKHLGVVSGIYFVGYGVIRICLEKLRPEGIIWRMRGAPVAVIFGWVSIIFGLILLGRRLLQQTDSTKYETN